MSSRLRLTHSKWAWLEEALRGDKPGFWASSLRRAATWSSLGYKAGVTSRETAYRRGWLQKKRLPRPTVCVGNITVGGTGKTPLVIRLAHDLLEKGLRPAVLLRGYKRERVIARPILVRDAKKILVSVKEAGDEAMELAERLPGACVGVGANRYAVGQAILKHQDVDCFILDDGFQHYQLDRDINIVALDVTDPWGGGKLLPAGYLRETPEALRRADLVVLTRTGLIAPDRLTVLRAEVKSFMKPPALIVDSRHQPRCLVSLANHHEVPLTSLKGKKILAVSGIGSPHSFETSLAQLGAELTDVLRLPDHGGRPREVWQWIGKHRQVGQWVVMTEKDALRWSAYPARTSERSHFYMLRVDLTIGQGEPIWKDLISKLTSVCHA